MSVNNIIFILGVGRSGTSLVQSILSSHSNLGSPPETAFVRRYIAASRLKKSKKRMDPARMETILSQDRKLRRLNLDWQSILSRLSDQNGPPFEVALYHAFMTEYLKNLKKERPIDKDPRLVEFLPTIKRWWPQAAIIHVIRDPRDVLASRKKADWSKNRPVWSHIFAYFVQLKIGRRLGPRLFGNNYIEIFYEKLIQSPGKTIRDLCNAIGEPFEAEMLDFTGTSKRLVSPDEMPWKKETLGPLLVNNSRKWPDCLSRWEVLLTETTCREGVEACGQGFSRVKGSPGTMVSKPIGQILRLLGPLYIQYRLWKQN